MHDQLLHSQRLDITTRQPPAFTSSAARSFILALAFLLFLLSLAGILVTARLAIRGHVDFRQLYAAGYMVRTGKASQLYNYVEAEKFQNQLVSHAEGALPFNHLAYESLIYAPLSFFSYQIAYLIFCVVNILVLAAAFQMLRHYLSALSQVWRFLPVCLFVCFLPVAIALGEGQDSILMLALFIGAMIAMHRGRELLAGALVALTLFKFQYAIPVALLFLVWRRWRFIVGFVLSGTALTGLSVGLTGTRAFGTYLHSLVEMSAKFSSAHGVQYGIRPELMPNLRGLVYAIATASPVTAHIIIAILSGIVILWTVRRRPSLPLALLAALLVSYHQFITDASLLLLPVGMALAATAGTDNRRAVYIKSVAGFVLVAPALLLLAGARFYLLPLLTLALLIAWDGQTVNAVPPVRHKIRIVPA